MKKIISLMLASAIALGCTFGLAACGGDDNSGDGTAGEVDNGILKSEKIDSAEAWAAAMDFSDVTNGTIYYFFPIHKGSNTYYFDGNKLKEEKYDLEADELRTKYCEYKDDEDYPGLSDAGTQYDYEYDSEMEKWTVEKHPRWRDEGVFMLADVFDNFNSHIDTGNRSELISQRYADFKYDESKYAYVATYEKFSCWTDAEAIDVYVEVKFKDGKIVEGCIKGLWPDGETGEHSDWEVRMKIYDLGTTTVTLPQVEA